MAFLNESINSTWLLFAVIIGLVLFYLTNKKQASYKQNQDTLTQVSINKQKMVEQKNYEDITQYMTYQDVLTGLPNRHQFNSYFQTTLVNKKIKNAVILYLNLDRFKVINETLGHASGDLLLKEVARKLRGNLRADDYLARLGGDEFILFLPNTDKEGAVHCATKMLQDFNEGFTYEDLHMYITLSIGMSLYPQDSQEVETLVKKADLAMNQVKRRGKNGFQFYENNCLPRTNDVFTLEVELRKAIEREEFIVHYQPKVNIESGEIRGLEALIRWQHPDTGLISPARFIPLAEETGMIVPIGEWVLRKACTEVKELREKGLPELIVSVNLSVRQFYQQNLIEMISRILKETKTAPELLEIEITESMMIDAHHALKIVRELKELGVRVSLDDFGTGYSSLHYLKQFPIDVIKIDQSFIKDCLSDTNNETIVKTIIAMAHQLKIDVISEGVETKEQLVFLQQNHCNHAQGYLFSKPVPLEEIAKNYQKIEQLVPQLGLPQDTVNQKWMAQALKLAQQELQETIRLQQGMTFKVKQVDGQFIHTMCDGELLYRMGFVPEEIIGKTLEEFFPSDLAHKISSCYKRVFQGEENVTFEAKYNEIDYLASLRAIRRGGQIVELVASCVDITYRKRIEEKLKISEENYRLIAENMSDLVRVVSPEGIIQYAPPSHKTVLGYTPEELEGTNTFRYIHPEDLPALQNTHYDVVSSSTPAVTELRHLHADGYWMNFEAKGTPIFGEDGRMKNLIIVARDISERKSYDESVRSSELYMLQ